MLNRLDFESVYSCSAPLALQRLLASMAGPSGLSIRLVQVWRIHLIQPRKNLHSAIHLESLYLHAMVKIDAVLFDDCAVVSMESCVLVLGSTVHGISVYKSGCTCIQSKITVSCTQMHMRYKKRIQQCPGSVKTTLPPYNDCCLLEG